MILVRHDAISIICPKICGMLFTCQRGCIICISINICRNYSNAPLNFIALFLGIATLKTTIHHILEKRTNIKPENSFHSIIRS